MDLDDGDAVFTAALAFIDDVYGVGATAKSSGKDSIPDSRRRLRCHAQRRDEIQQLRRDAEELRYDVERLRASRRRNSSERSRLWADIALRQRGEREKSVRENALLKEVARTQLSLARRVDRVLDEFIRLQPAQNSCGVVVHKPLAATPFKPVLSRRINEVTKSARLEWTSEKISVESTYRRATVEPDSTGSGIIVRVTRVTFHPYKMSVVSDVIWKLLAGNSIEFYGGQANEIWSTCKYSIDKPFGHFEVQGPSVLRRVYSHDGSVVMAWASLSSPDEVSRQMHGLEIHETAWLRIQRTHVTNNKSIVKTESVHSLHIRPATPDVKRTQVERIAAFVARSFNEDAEVHRQHLENHLLDASISAN